MSNVRVTVEFRIEAGPETRSIEACVEPKEMKDDILTSIKEALEERGPAGGVARDRA